MERTKSECMNSMFIESRIDENCMQNIRYIGVESHLLSFSSRNVLDRS